ncbi:transcription initiation factor TFIID subunit 5-like isoform X2 [Mytilus californianus]|nr:transcription initiation factor TFIID subunit 5-like isoform X2 [Mytilus californianus]
MEFFHKFSGEQEYYYQDDLKQLSSVTKREHMRGNQLMDNFKASRFIIKMSRDSYNHLKRYLQENQMKPLLTIIQEHLFIDVFDGVPRNKQQITATGGGLLGEAERDANKAKVFYGLLKEPDINIPVDDDDEAPEGEDKPKKKKAKKDPLLMRKSKNDPHAPQSNRIPLPELKDQDKLEKINSFREAIKRVRIGADQMPTVCFYSITNAHQGVTTVNVCEDSSLMSAGFADSTIRVFTLTPSKLRGMKSGDDLEIIDKDSDDVLERMMDDRSSSEVKSLVGHSGPVYATDISHDKKFLISSSEDGSVRLWSLLTWSNLVCYKGHQYPVWDAKFSPHGHYFVSCGHDRTARLWSTDHYQPLRIYAGHLSDVDCVEFHPNSNYIVTGSSDRVVRMWDNQSGNCVRTFTGHKGPIHKMCFSPDGRFIATGGVDKTILLWDIASGNMLAQLKGHTQAVYSLTFSREGSVLSSGGLDSCVKIWDVNRVLQEYDTDSDATIPSSLQVNDNANLLLGSFPTKQTSVLCVHFTRKNLLLASGPVAI